MFVVVFFIQTSLLAKDSIKYSFNDVAGFIKNGRNDGLLKYFLTMNANDILMRSCGLIALFFDLNVSDASLFFEKYLFIYFF